MNLETIFNSEMAGATVIRRETLRENFDEVGYLVEFLPKMSKGVVRFRSRHHITRDKLVEMFQILKKYTGRDIPFDDRGRILSETKHGMTMLASSVFRAGLLDIGTCWGTFELEVYSAEAFAKNLAEWLEEWHAEKWRWVSIQNTKLNEYDD